MDQKENNGEEDKRMRTNATDTDTETDKKKDEVTTASDKDINTMDPVLLREEIQRIINNMGCPKNCQEENENSLIEVSLKEVKIKSDLQKHGRRQTRCRADYSSSTAHDKVETCSDSARTDEGIPPIPTCDPSRPVSPRYLEKVRHHSAIVLDHMSRRKLYVPGRVKSDFFLCPHKRFDDVAGGAGMQHMIHRQNVENQRFNVEKQFGGYNGNEYSPGNSKQNLYKYQEESRRKNRHQSLFKRMKFSLRSCIRRRKKRNRLQEAATEARAPPSIPQTEALCYCGSGFLSENHRKANEYSSVESFDQLYKAKVDTSSNPKSFVFRAVDRDALMSHGEVHMMMDGRQPEPEQYLKQQQQINFPPAPPPDEENNNVYMPQPPVMIMSQNIPQSIEPPKRAPSITFNNETMVGTSYHPVSKKPERIDIYMFDHQDSRYFHTTDNPPPVLTEAAVHETERLATQFWADVFSIIHFVFAFITTFILQLTKFVLIAIIRPLTTGLIQIISDYFFKPLLTIVFNGLIQPVLIFMYNIFTSFRDLCRPLASGVGFFLRELAAFISAFRLCKVNVNTNNGPFLARHLPNKV